MVGIVREYVRLNNKKIYLDLKTNRGGFGSFLFPYIDRVERARDLSREINNLGQLAYRNISI